MDNENVENLDESYTFQAQNLKIDHFFSPEFLQIFPKNTLKSCRSRRPRRPRPLRLGRRRQRRRLLQGAAEVGGAGSGAERCQGATAGEDLDILGWLGTDFWRFWGCFCGWFMVISWIYHELILIWVIMISTWWTSWILHPTESRSDSVVCSLCIKPTYTLRVNVEVYLADNVGWLNIDILNVDVQPLWRNQWTLEVQDHNIYIFIIPIS